MAGAGDSQNKRRVFKSKGNERQPLRLRRKKITREAIKEVGSRRIDVVLSGCRELWRPRVSKMNSVPHQGPRRRRLTSEDVP